jgi:hypothetical protein
MTRATPERMSIAQLRDLQARTAAAPSMNAMRDNPAEKSRKNGQKYGNTKVVDRGIKFDSKAEHKRWVYLAMLEKAGEIKDLRMQVPFELIPAQVTPDGLKVRGMSYVADFTYLDKNGALIVEDPKGAETPIWRIKKKLMLQVHGIWVKEIRS